MEQQKLIITEGSSKFITVRSPLPPRLYCLNLNVESKILVTAEVIPEPKPWRCPAGNNLTQLVIGSLPGQQNTNMTPCTQVITNEYSSWKQKPTNIILQATVDGIRDRDHTVTVAVTAQLICSPNDTVIQPPSYVTVSNVISRKLILKKTILYLQYY